MTERFIRGVVAALRLARPPARSHRAHARVRLDRRAASALRARVEYASLARVLPDSAQSRRVSTAPTTRRSSPTSSSRASPLIFGYGPSITLTRLSVRDNYFLHHMLTGAYPARRSGRRAALPQRGRQPRDLRHERRVDARRRLGHRIPPHASRRQRVRLRAVEHLRVARARRDRRAVRPGRAHRARRTPRSASATSSDGPRCPSGGARPSSRTARSASR